MFKVTALKYVDFELCSDNLMSLSTWNID